MDDDGYPEEHELKAIREWPRTDLPGLLDYVRERWAYADCGYFEQDGRAYNISTAGWSGNEDIIGALQENRSFWVLCWQSSKRGGHYQFEIPASLVGAEVPNQE
jgi:hypothetical protein